MNKILPEKRQLTVSPVYLLLTLAGLSFCFFLGFPFDNQNESFQWIIVFKKVGLIDTLTRQVSGNVETFRPLGMASAWIGYYLTGHIYLQQLINWLFAVSSFILLYFATGNKILFSLLSFITCAAFFSGYIYLFHLHGVFYGPFQLYVAFLAWIGFRYKTLSPKMAGIITAITVIVCLYHTFALLVFCGFISGYIIQLKKTGKKSDYIRLIVLVLGALLFAKIIMQAKELKTAAALLKGILTSYSMMEINKTLSLLAMALSVAAGVSLMKTLSHKILAAGSIVIVSALFIWWGLPVLLIWVLISAIAMLVAKNWAMAALVATTAILPLGSSSGSPTYIVFVLMVCTFITASVYQHDLYDYPLIRKSGIAGLASLLVCLVALKQGVNVPLASSVAKPILAEQEKTHQFNDILKWKLESKEYASNSLLSYDSWGLPVNSVNAVDRKHRPVTEQAAIDDYLTFFSGDSLARKTKTPLYVTFGNKTIPGKELVFSVAGRWNGQAGVFR